MKRIFEVTKFTGEPHVVNVKNIGEMDYKYHWGSVKLILPIGDTQLVQTDLAKALLGDWDKEHEYKEKKRRERSGITDIKLRLKEETREVEVKRKEEEILDVLPVEEEFTALKEETVQCTAITGAGKRCKNESLDGEKFCKVHIKKHKGE